MIRPSDASPELSWIVHYGVFDAWETLLDVDPGSLRIRRRDGEGSSRAWRRRRLDLHRPHAVAIMPDHTAIIADTDNDRIVVLPRLDRGEPRCRRIIGNMPLRRPHHVLYNPHDGYTYVVDQNGIYRIRHARDPGQAWPLSAGQLGYARSLALLDNRVHVVASTRGAVLRIDDFERRVLTTFRSPGKRGTAPAGTWLDTGFILNDVAQECGWYYGTNYFTPDHADRGDARVLRLVRWKTWGDFRRGRWQDLSGCLGAGLIPYFLTVVDHRLHLSVFCHADHSRDGIFLVNPQDLT